jgi:hypothetical protein
MMKMPETFTTVVVSTAHIPEEIARKMDEGREINGGSGCYFVYDNIEYGYRIHVGGTSWWAAAPISLHPILKAANEAGHRWIEFDCDGDVLDGFETWEW